MKKILTVLCLLFLLAKSSMALPCMHADSLQGDTSKKNRILPGPVFNYTPETSFVLGLSMLYTFYLDHRDETRSSLLFVTGIYTFKQQLITGIYLNTWSKKNRYHYVLDVGYNKYNYFYYGIGNSTRLADEVLLNQRETRFSATVEKKIFDRYYAGFDLSYKRDLYGADDAARILQLNAKTLAPGGASILRAGLSLILDTRNSVNYATQGHYVRLNYTQTLPVFRENFIFNRYTFESRDFFTLATDHVLAFNTMFESAQGDVPFFELRQLGNPFIMRGYYMGRFRDKNLAASQVEYRWHILKRIGLVAFAGTGSVFDDTSLKFTELKPNLGLGFRYFYDIPSGLNIRMDYGIGEKIPGEKRIANFYLYISESF